MALSDFGTFIVIMAHMAQPDKMTLDFIEQTYGESYTAAALTQFRKRHSIHKNTQSEYVACCHGLEIVERFTSGETVKDIAADLGFSVKHVSFAIKAKGESTEKRCTQDFLLTEFRSDLFGFLTQNTPCREAAEWLEKHRNITCSKNVVLAAMQSIKKQYIHWEKIAEIRQWLAAIPENQRVQTLTDISAEIQIILGELKEVT